MQTEETTGKAGSAGHLRFVDGLRGLAAFYVVLFHCYRATDPTREAFERVRGLEMGHYAVTGFLALSGYCLLLPIVRTWNNGRDWSEVAEFFRRRALRILPAYYASIALYLVLWRTGVIHGYAIWKGASNITPAGILSHLLMLQNVFPARPHSAGADQICGVYWSLAVESQIYVLFPLMVWAWRRLGVAYVLVGSVCLGWLYQWNISAYPFHMLNVAGLSGHYAAVFVAGAIAAWIGHSTDAAAAAIRQRVPWGIVLAAGLLHTYYDQPTPNSIISDDLVFGDWSLTFLVYLPLLVCCMRFRRLGEFFALRPFAGLGAISYSLYLVHTAVVAVITERLILPSPAMTEHALGWEIVLSMPLSILAGALFYFAIERPALALREAWRLPTGVRGGDVRRLRVAGNPPPTKSQLSEPSRT